MHRMRTFQEELETEAKFHIILPDGAAQEWRYPSDHPSYPVRWIVREAFQYDLNRELYGSSDPSSPQVSRQRGMEFVYREFMHREYTIGTGNRYEKFSDAIVPRIDVLLGALFEDDVYVDRVLTGPLTQYDGYYTSLFSLDSYMNSSVELVLFWLGEHGVLMETLDQIARVFKATTHDSSIMLYQVQEILQYFLLTTLMTVLYDADIKPGIPWSWRAPVHITALLERLDDLDGMQQLVDLARW